MLALNANAKTVVRSEYKIIVLVTVAQLFYMPQKVRRSESSMCVVECSPNSQVVPYQMTISGETVAC